MLLALVHHVEDESLRTLVSGQDPPASNRLSDAPAAPRQPNWDRSRDSLRAVHEMVAPDDLSVVFQPIVKLANTRLFAYEALVRCRVPQYANPLVLFQQAVAAGCAGRMGRMIREIAVQLAGSTPLFVNVHPHELSESWLVRPDDPIYQHDDEVYLELTESVPLTHFDLCLNVLREVRNRGGVHLVVDDLGAGCSNLKRIADLEPRVVKLDRDLISGLDRSERQRKMVTSVVRLCKQLDAVVVAEGVETADEHFALVDTGANYAQGYVYARPGYPIPSIQVPRRV